MTKKAILHFFIEFIPTFGFFIAAQFTTFYIATAILMGLAAISFVLGWLYERTLPLLPVITVLFIMVPGGITLYSHQPDVLIMANSVYFLLFAGALIGGLLIKQNIIEIIFNKTFAITKQGWNILALRWAVLFVAIGIGNEYIRIFYNEQVWVDYKFFTTIVMSVFAVSQLWLSRAYRLPKYGNAWGIRIKDDPQY